MFITSFIYFNIGVCILLIIFEVSWNFFIKVHNKNIEKYTIRYKDEIQIQLNYIKENNKTNDMYFKGLEKELKSVNKLKSFENAYNEFSCKNYEEVNIYTEKLLELFENLSLFYAKRKNNIQKAYIAHLIGKYFGSIKDKEKCAVLIEVLYKFMDSKYIYCRINAMEAIFLIGTVKNIIRVMFIINKNKYTYNQEMIVQWLKKARVNKKELAQELFKGFEKYNKNIQISIIKFLSNFPYIGEGKILEKLKDENTLIDVKCEIMRYFQKNKNNEAKNFLMNKLNKEVIIANDLNVKAIGTLGYYEEDEVIQLLTKLKEYPDSIIKESAYKSLEKRHSIHKDKLLELL